MKLTIDDGKPPLNTLMEQTGSVYASGSYQPHR